MGTTQKLQAILMAKEAIRLAIIDKGVAVAEEVPLSDYSAAIAEISTGGLGPTFLVEYYDWDNTLLKTQEVLQGGDVLPPDDPSRPPYVFDGWDGGSLNVQSDLVITAQYLSDPVIEFADATVGAICAANWGADGVIKQSQAAAVTAGQLGETFKANTAITSFPELQYFTGLTSIPENAFNGCTNLAGALNIPINVNSIGGYAFYGCKFTGTLTIPASVSAIGSYAFYGCTGFTGNLVIPNTAMALASGGYQFYGCTGFNGTLTIGTGVTAIPTYCFRQCTGLTGNLVIPNNVTSLGANAFGVLTGMTGTLTIGTGITTLPLSCFSGCTFTGAITIPANVTTLEAQCFYSCAGFTGNLVIPATVTTMDWAAGKQFYGCIGLTGTLTLGGGCSSIPYQCFYNCRFSGTITIPATITQINTQAFYNLQTPNISYFYDQRTTPPSAGTSILGTTGTYPIYVPAASVAAYKAAAGWSTYTARIYGY